MLRSMTGFGRCFLEDAERTQVWEIRSVNGRHLDIRWRLPASVRPFEAALERIVKTHASRGRLEISLHLDERAYGQSASFNEDLADAMLEKITSFATARGDEFVPDYTRLLGLSFLWDEGLPEEDDELGESLEQGLLTALADWNESRTMEGAALEKDLLARILHMEEWVARIAERAPAIKEERFAVVRARLEEVLEGHGLELEEGRFLQESVILADRLDVSEELTRLNTHLARLHDLLQTGGDAGRRLDFTLQECFREINTCGNKLPDVQLSRMVVDFKNELEKCREQVQNLE